MVIFLMLDSLNLNANFLVLDIKYCAYNICLCLPSY